MQVFCPSCGHSNETTGEGKVTCATCTAVFDPPGPRAPPPPPPGPAPQEWRAPPPPPPPFIEAERGRALSPSQAPHGGTPVEWNQNGSALADGRSYSTQAVASLVCGILCCIPVASFVAVFLGVRALKEVERQPQKLKGRELAIVGIALGALGSLSWVLGLLVN